MEQEVSEMTTFDLGNFTTQQEVDKLIEKAHGKTCMNFQVHYGIMGVVNYPVSISTDYEGTREEISTFLMFFLATNL